jgi:hypothetical protein
MSWPDDNMNAIEDGFTNHSTVKRFYGNLFVILAPE